MLSSDGLDADKHAEHIATIASRVEAVQRMLEQLFEYARIEANELTLASEPVHLNNVLRDVVSLFYDDFCAKDEQPSVCIPDEAFVVRGDADALHRVFANILHNSLLHGDGEFSIHSEKRGGRCTLCFSNRTHSVSTGDIEHCSSGFTQPTSRAPKKSTGLGLQLPEASVRWAATSATLSNGVFSVGEFPIRRPANSPSIGDIGDVLRKKTLVY
ncbi:MAG: sensor histidine kinase [Oscillospiraceae bacterium]